VYGGKVVFVCSFMYLMLPQTTSRRKPTSTGTIVDAWEIRNYEEKPFTQFLLENVV
jgi:hypothetical protein